MTTDASAPRRKLSAIVMVDVSGFSRMMGRNEERTTKLIREFHDRTRGSSKRTKGVSSVVTIIGLTRLHRGDPGRS